MSQAVLGSHGTFWLDLSTYRVPASNEAEEEVGFGEDFARLIRQFEDIDRHYWIPFSRQERNSLQRFYTLLSTWRRDIQATSSITEMAMHPAYQQIIGMGPVAVPLLLRELEHQPDHLFWALKAITGEDPVPLEDRGWVDRMCRAWLKWGEKHGYERWPMTLAFSFLDYFSVAMR